MFSSYLVPTFCPPPPPVHSQWKWGNFNDADLRNGQTYCMQVLNMVQTKVWRPIQQMMTSHGKLQNKYKYAGRDLRWQHTPN